MISRRSWIYLTFLPLLTDQHINAWHLFSLCNACNTRNKGGESPSAVTKLGFILPAYCQLIHVSVIGKDFLFPNNFKKSDVYDAACNMSAVT